MSMHPKEFETTVQLPAKKRYDYFIKKIVDFEEVWSLRNEKGWVMSEDEIIRKYRSFIFGRQRSMPLIVRLNYGENLLPEMIDLDDFLEEWLPGMIADGINPSIFYNRNDSVSIEIPTLKEDVEEELKNY